MSPFSLLGRGLRGERRWEREENKREESSRREDGKGEDNISPLLSQFNNLISKVLPVITHITLGSKRLNTISSIHISYLHISSQSYRSQNRKTDQKMR
ncbi:hypothetical protein EYC80_004408 [Monilinia laxa]|uniref:Uncharacterized protein n=1 Tax=Monilinia laxa TaxID=61186 RepID=A0A5N6KMS6_MONLA|nr:hypothetical protein EYC80_004408 [Monilinia laxa]